MKKCWIKSLSLLILSFFGQGMKGYEIQSSRSDYSNQDTTIMWSILICTLEERKEKFDFIYNKLLQQIKKAGLDDRIEILYFCDDREYSIGFKRNALMDASKGAYINYIDDDDDVSANYIEMIYERLLKSPDVVKLMGVITFNGNNPRYFIHSIEYNSYFERRSVYYRPPNHLNPMKREIASQFKFPGAGRMASNGEDTDWAMRIARSGLLKTEENVTEPYYFYLYVEGSRAHRAKKLQ